MSNPFEHKPLFAYLALVVGVFCIGLSAIFVKFANVAGPVSAFYRVLIAGLVLIPWWLLRKTKCPAIKDILLIFTGGAFFAFDLALWNTSLLLTSAATATLLANAAPLWVGMGTLMIFRERLSRKYWLGLFISLLGMSLVMGTDAWRSLQFNNGDLMALGASVFYAGYLVTTQRSRSRVDTQTFMTFSVIANIIVLFLLNLMMGTKLGGYSGSTWMTLLGLGIISHLCGWLAINYALGHLKAAPVSVTLLGQTIVTTILAIPLLGEYLNIQQILGGIAVLIGIYIVNTRQHSAGIFNQTQFTLSDNQTNHRKENIL
ncbi:MAG: DMT family transporter [Candidatus Marinimicrobia bacterium]|nr:DMT family transporter [Candidatus Neomarinimicrobiota bacterium]